MVSPVVVSMVDIDRMSPMLTTQAENEIYGRHPDKGLNAALNIQKNLTSDC